MPHDLSHLGFLAGQIGRLITIFTFFFFSSRRRHTRCICDWSSDVCSSDLSILKHADFSLGDLPEFLDRLSRISRNYGMDFVVSLSAEKEEMIGVDFKNYELLN